MKIGILGLGLIGGSIAKGIKKKKPAVQIYSLSSENVDLKAAVACTFSF
jgi:prephenate dehydrogenase